MTSKERWLAVLKREKPDRIPMDYWATAEATEKLMKYLGINTQEALFKRLHIDKPVTVGPKYIGPSIPEGNNLFGCRYKNVDYGTGVYSECIFHPLAKYKTIEEIKKNYKWPNPDWYDYSEIPRQIEDKEDYSLISYPPDEKDDGFGTQCRRLCLSSF